jgi:hypothetical protein
MRRTIAIAFAFSFALLTGCGSEEKKEEPSTLPSSDKMFDKSKQPMPKLGDPANKKGTAG